MVKDTNKRVTLTIPKKLLEEYEKTVGIKLSIALIQAMESKIKFYKGSVKNEM